VPLNLDTRWPKAQLAKIKPSWLALVQMAAMTNDGKGGTWSSLAALS